mmetsp:Transcript_17082/g.26446  ORF Transcript_17082/g.26446 Transcript_17082/m.26446 type:complete len:172 (-) Transcript_17082:410-925(-)
MLSVPPSITTVSGLQLSCLIAGRACAPEKALFQASLSSTFISSAGAALAGVCSSSILSCPSTSIASTIISAIFPGVGFRIQNLSFRNWSSGSDPPYPPTLCQLKNLCAEVRGQLGCPTPQLPGYQLLFVLKTMATQSASAPQFHHGTLWDHLTTLHYSHSLYLSHLSLSAP